MGNESYILIIVFALLVFLGVRFLMRRNAMRKVNEKDWTKKVEAFQTMLKPYGFTYNEQEDIIESMMNPWQRKFGYCRLYDQQAAKVNMILDCEPIYFSYDNKRWMIELWKGQYGVSAGAEIGIYVTDQEDIEIPGVFKGPFFHCVQDEERIDMKFQLVHQGRELFRREGHHWWLTGFSIGSFSKLEQLAMQVELTFPNEEMKNSFLSAMIEMGYGKTGIGVKDNTVFFQYDQPLSKQPKRGRMITALRMSSNGAMCWAYNRITRKLITSLDKTIFFKYYYPISYRIFWSRLKNIKPEELLEKPYNKISKYIK